jgi:hypothetical protein
MWGPTIISASRSRGRHANGFTAAALVSIILQLLLFDVPRGTPYHRRREIFFEDILGFGPISLEYSVR